jgi:hypothetical protein
MFRLRHAYGTIDWANTSILFGQYWDMFAPMVANTQDFRCGATTGAPNNPRSPMIKLTQRVNLNQDNQLQLVVGVTDPTQYGDNAGPGLPATNAFGAGVNYAGQAFFVSKALGVAPGYFGLANNPFKIGFFGEYGNEHLQVSNSKALDTWGYGAYIFAPILKSSDGKSRAMTMSFEGQVYEAANMAYNAATASTIANTGNATAVTGAFANSITAGTGASAADVQAGLQPRRDLGMAAQIIFYPTQELGLTAGWGERIAANEAADVSATGSYQKYNQEFYFNAAYDLNAAVRVAAEYQYLEAGWDNTTPTAFNTNGKALSTVNIGRLCAYYFF